MTPKTKIAIINSISNPAGTVYQAEELLRLFQVGKKPGTLVLSDDVYEKFVYDDERFVNLLTVAPDLKDQVVIVNSASPIPCRVGAWDTPSALN